MVLDVLRMKVQENPKWIEKSPNYTIAKMMYPDIKEWALTNNFNEEEINKAFETLRMEYLNRKTDTEELSDTPTELPTVIVREEPLDISQGMAKEIYDYIKSAKMEGRLKNCYSVAKIHNPVSLVEWRDKNGYPDKLVERIFNLVDREIDTMERQAFVE
jgi:hypothetical protein